MTDGPTYASWWGAVRERLDNGWGEDLETHPELPLRAWYDEGLDPQAAALRAAQVLFGR